MPALPEARPLTLQASGPATHLERIQLDSLSAAKTTVSKRVVPDYGPRTAASEAGRIR